MYKSIRFRLICLMLIIMAFAGVLMGCGKSSNYQKGQQQTAEPIETQSFTGIITRIDKKLKQISVREIDTDVDTMMHLLRLLISIKKRLTGMSLSLVR